MQLFNDMLMDYETLISGEDSVVSGLEIEDLVNIALKAIYKYDKYLIDIKAHERDIVFRFGIYFQRLLEKHDLFKTYNLDVDYNRNGHDPKRTENSSDKGVYPDVILHKRGHNNDNLLILEFKGYWNNNRERIEKDERTIRDLMSPTGDYKYQKGYWVLLDKVFSPQNLRNINDDITDWNYENNI